MKRKILSIILSCAMLMSPTTGFAAEDITVSNEITANVSGYVSVENGHFLAGQDGSTDICVDADEYEGVTRAAGDLANDISNVTGKTPEIVTEPQNNADCEIIIGTIGKSDEIDRLITENKLDVS